MPTATVQLSSAARRCFPCASAYRCRLLSSSSSSSLSSPAGASATRIGSNGGGTRLSVRSLTTGPPSKRIGVAGPSSSSSSSKEAKRLAAGIDRRGTMYKYARISGLVAGVYSLGYQMGVMDFSSNPEKKERALLNSVLKSAGCRDPENPRSARIAADGDWLALDDSELRRIALVGEKIVHVGRKYARDEKKKLEDELIKQLPYEVTSDPARLKQALDLNETLDARARAADLMDGRWSYVLFDSPAPNAFVTQLLPRKIFVTRALMDKFVERDDELAIVLGHEVSHLILGHVGKRNLVEAVVSTLEVMLLTALDAGGISGFRLIVALETVRRWFGNAYSRENEHEADELGIQLAAMACFDTRKGAEVFRKMMACDPAGPKWLLRFEMDHPLTEDRYKYLLEASETENEAKYRSTTCADVCRKFKAAGGNYFF